MNAWTNKVHSKDFQEKRMEEARSFPKSRWYRQSLAPYIGKEIVIESNSFEIQQYKSQQRVCVREPRVRTIEDAKAEAYGNTPEIEHVWVLIDGVIFLDPSKPVRMVGKVYEYAHKNIRNLGVQVQTVCQ